MSSVDEWTIYEDEYETLTALITEYAVEGRATVRSVSKLSGLNPAVTVKALLRLVLIGLADWTPRWGASFRPNVTIVGAIEHDPEDDR